jgi:hypothetical protein
MTPLAEIDWAALAEAAWISVAVGLGVLFVAALAVTSSLRAQDSRGGTATVYSAVSVACVVGLVAAVILGIYFMTDK